jgi:hypothetical protein
MTKPQVTIKPVRVYEVLGADGRSLGLFRAGEDWQGMRALTALVPAPDPRHPNPPHGTIVIEAPNNLVELFTGTLGEGVLADVIKCSPSLLLDILGNRAVEKDTHHVG